MTRDKVRLGFIGANLRSDWAPHSHFPALLASRDVELTAVCTTRPETAEEARQALGAKLAFSDWRELVASPEIDAIAVVVKVREHYLLTKTALEAGKHVYCEWPLGRTTAEAEELAALAHTTGLQAVVGLQSRVSPALLHVKELLESGYLGEVLCCNTSGFRFGRTAGLASRTWQTDASYGMNTLTIASGHVLDAVRFVAGDFAQLRCLLATRTPRWHETDTGRTVDVTTPDNVLVTGRLASGAVAAVHVAAVSWAGSGFRLELYGRDGTLVVTGSVASQRGEALRVRGAHHRNDLADLTVPERFSFVPPDFPRGDPFNVGQLYALFAEAIRTGHSQVPIPTFDTAVELHRLLDGITQSSESANVLSLV